MMKGIAVKLKEIPLHGGHSIAVVSNEDGALLRLRNAGAEEGLEIEICWSPQGPVARVRAARIDLQTTADLKVHCSRFEVEATQGISLLAQGDLKASGASVAVEARDGSVVAQANDDVQLLGEEILLNCDRTPQIPVWANHGPGLLMNQLVGLTEASGDDDLIAAVRGGQDKGHAPR